MGESYLKAAEKLLPNLGLHKDDSRANGYYRSNAWITAAIEPISAPQTLGDGSTGIGEPFGNFGYFGVVGFFTLLGFGLASLEIYSLTIRSMIGSAVLASIFIPVNWYVRDDIYGLARPIVWPLVTIVGAYLYFLVEQCLLERVATVSRFTPLEIYGNSHRNWTREAPLRILHIAGTYTSLDGWPTWSAIPKL